MRTFLFIAALPVMLAGCQVPDHMASSAYVKETLRDKLRFESPNKAVALHYARGDESRYAPDCSEKMRPYAALRLRSADDHRVVALGKRDGDYVAETPMGKNRYGKSYVSVGTAKQYAGRTAIVNYRLEF